MKLLDLFCGAGGAAMGYSRAGFTEIVGVDLKPQRRYPFHFVQADALDFVKSYGPGFDAIHASPPCQGYMQCGMIWKTRGVYPKLIPDVRMACQRAGRPYVLENVPGAPITPTFILCGSMFGLGIKRHRLFEVPSVFALHPSPCDHSRPITGVYGHCHGQGGAWRKGSRPMLPSSKTVWSTEMGIDWMTAAELSQAIPPAYTEFIGRQLLNFLLSTACNS